MTMISRLSRTLATPCSSVKKQPATTLLALVALGLCLTGRSAQAQGPAVILASTNIGSSTTGSVTFTVSGTVSTSVATTQGITGLDFTVLGDSCTSTSCTASVKFAPVASGIRYGSVIAKNAAGATIGYGLVTGVGLAPYGVVYPAAQTALITGQDQVYGVVADAAGNLYAADDAGLALYKFTKSGSTYTRAKIGASPSQPDYVAIDGAGNLYLADYYGSSGNAGQIYKFTYSNGAYTANGVVVNLPANSYGGTVAIDSSGNLYLSTAIGNIVKATLQPSGTYVTSTLFAGGAFTSTQGVAVDAAGNVYVANQDPNTASNNFVGVEKYSGGSYTYQRISTFVNPISVAVDAGGNVYVADSGTYTGTATPDPGSAVYMETPSGGSYVQTTLGTGYLGAACVFADQAGKIYVCDFAGNAGATGYTTDSTIYLIDPTASPTFAFGSVAVTQSSATQTATLVNTGSAALTFTTPASGATNPSITSGFAISNSSTCPQLTSGSSTQTLAAGNLCTDVVKFSPIASGSQSGQLITTDNNLYGSSTQVVNLNGTGTVGSTAQTITFTQPASPVTYPAVTSDSLSASSTSNLAITFVVTSGPGIISGSSVIFSGAGTVVVQAQQAGNGTYAAATPVSRSITVMTADSTSTAVTLGSNSITVGGTLLLTATVSDTTNTGTHPTGTVTFYDTLNGNKTTAASGITVTNGVASYTYTAASAGAHTITATYVPSGSFNASSDTTGKPLTITQATQTGYGYTSAVTQGTAASIDFKFSYPGPIAPTGAITVTVGGSTANLSGLTCVYKTLHSNCQITYTAPANLPTLSYTISFTQAADANYTTSTGTGTLLVAPSAGNARRPNPPLGTLRAPVLPVSPALLR